MRKQISYTLIILALLFFCASYASENEVDQEIASSSKQVDTIPKVLHAVAPSISMYSKITAAGNDQLENVNEGRVLLKIVVTKEGKVRDPEVVESTPSDIFDKYALKTIMEYRFKPAMKDGKPVDFIVKLPMEFKIPQTNSSYTAYKERVKGRKFFQSGEFEKALEAYSEAIKIDKNYSAYYSDRGNTYIALGDFKKAISEMNRAIELSPDESVYYKIRSDAYMKLADTKNMCLDLKKACELGDCSGFDEAKKTGKCN